MADWYFPLPSSQRRTFGIWAGILLIHRQSTCLGHTLMHNVWETYLAHRMCIVLPYTRSLTDCARISCRGQSQISLWSHVLASVEVPLRLSGFFYHTTPTCCGHSCSVIYHNLFNAGRYIFKVRSEPVQVLMYAYRSQRPRAMLRISCDGPIIDIMRRGVRGGWRHDVFDVFDVLFNKPHIFLL